MVVENSSSHLQVKQLIYRRICNMLLNVYIFLLKCSRLLGSPTIKSEKQRRHSLIHTDTLWSNLQSHRGTFFKLHAYDLTINKRWLYKVRHQFITPQSIRSDFGGYLMPMTSPSTNCGYTKSVSSSSPPSLSVATLKVTPWLFCIEFMVAICTVNKVPLLSSIHALDFRISQLHRPPITRFFDCV